MKRYRLQNGWPLEAPLCGVTAEGHAVSNFRRRIERDEAFAAANGYFPMGAVQPPEPPLREGFDTVVEWHLENGCWQRSFSQAPSPTEGEPLLD